MMKKLFLIVQATIFLLLLNACGSSDGGDSPANEPLFKNIEQANTMLSSLENELETKYGFDFVYHDKKFAFITPPENPPTDWLKQFYYYKDSVDYSANLMLLKQYQDTLRKENETLFDELINKTRSMSELISDASYEFSRLGVDELETYDYEVIPDRFLNFQGLTLYTYEHQPNTGEYKALEWSSSARELCRMLVTLNALNPSVDRISSCADYPKVKILSVLSKDEEVSSTVRKTNLDLLRYYDGMADEYMKTSGIELNANFTEGYNTQKRSEYEQSILSENQNIPESTAKQALSNNLYENLFFKSSVLSQVKKLFNTTKEFEDILLLSETALSSTSHHPMDLTLGVSPFDSNSKIGTENLSNIPKVHPISTKTNESTPSQQTSQNQAPAQQQQRESDSAPEGDSSSAPINTSEDIEIVVPKDVEDFFAD